jgi:hypothetical protein
LVVNIDRVLFLLPKDNEEWGWVKNGDEKRHGKYIGKIKDWRPNGLGRLTWPDGESMKENSMTVNSMAKEQKLGQMETNMWVYLEEVKFGMAH